MVICLDKTLPDIPSIVFSLERADFINEVGHKFIRELKVRLQQGGAYYYTYKMMGVLIIILDYEYFHIFIDVFKKYYPHKYKTQKVKIFEDEIQ